MVQRLSISPYHDILQFIITHQVNQMERKMASNPPSEKNSTKQFKLSNAQLATIFQVIVPPFTFNHQHFFFKPNSTATLPLSPLHLLHNLHNSISSTANNFLHFLHNFSATHNNPFFNKLLSFASHIRDFSLVHYRNRNSSNFLANHNFAAVLPGDSVAGVVVGNGIMNFLNIYNTLLVVRLVLTWFPNAPPQIVSPLSTLCDPYLNIFRGIIPPLGGTLDLSPILAFLVLNAFTSAAAALPAELPPAMASHEASLKPGLSDLTISQRKWQRRLQSKSSDAPK